MRSSGAACETSEPALPGLARRVLWLCAVATIGAALTQLDHTLCPFANVVGQPCPGCGFTRAGIALLHLDLGTALHYHPMSLAAAPLLAYLVVRGTHTYLLGRAPRWAKRVDAAFIRSGLAKWQDWFWGTLALLLLGIWVARFFGALGGPVELSPQPRAPMLLGDHP